MDEDEILKSSENEKEHLINNPFHNTLREASFLYLQKKRSFVKEKANLKEKQKSLTQLRTSQSFYDKEPTIDIIIAKSFRHSTLFAIFLVLLYLILGMLLYHFYEGWDFLTSIYFSAVTLTTVGYGDIYPTSTGVKIITIFFILFGVSIIGFALSIIGSSIIERQENLLYSIIENSEEGVVFPQVHETRIFIKKLILTLTILLLVIAIGSIVVAPLEDWSIIDAVYWCIVTVTTVGYGDLAPQTLYGRIFAFFYVLFGTVIFMGCIGHIAHLFVEKHQKTVAERILKRRPTLEFFSEIDKKHIGEIDRQEFLEFMLVKLEKCSVEDLQHINAQFDKLDQEHSGKIHYQNVILNNPSKT